MKTVRILKSFLVVLLPLSSFFLLLAYVLSGFYEADQVKRVVVTVAMILLVLVTFYLGYRMGERRGGKKGRLIERHCIYPR